uniref:Enoyl-[acyl-carrier-protein] reductase, mitochondrial n=1 Tax=Pristionchus pacificus TaxID=54126 RepID=A0A8R1Z9K4_PRIPA
MLSSTRLSHSIHSLRSLSTLQLVYSEHGDPSKVIRPSTVSLPSSVPCGQVRVSWLAAPINPADINQIQGVYPVKPPLPAVGGNEGVGRIEEVGSDVSSFKKGDLVIPARSGLGTWRKMGDHSVDHVWPIDNRFSIEAGATLQVNPSTAYRMLKDFEDLKEGDTVIQNGANSGVGRSVMQICKIRGLKCVSVVRSRDTGMDELREELSELGSTTVVTEEEMASKMRGKVKARLALNCVGGRSSLFLAGAVAKRGTMVTYGGMSKQPLSIPTAAFIFNDISLRGFWMSRWYDEGNTQERTVMYRDLADWFASGRMKTPPFEKIPMDDATAALEKAQTKFDKKMLFV